MDFNWFFRKGRNGFGNSDFFSDKDEPNIGDQSEEDFPSFDVPFVDPFGNMEDTSHDLFKRIDDMLNQMFDSSINSFAGSIKFEDGPRETDPRSMMLKDPDCVRSEQCPVEDPFKPTKPSVLVDNDIDEEVAKNGLILDTRTTRNIVPKSFSYKKFSTIRTVHLPDGTMEEHRTVSDSHGNVTTTIRRSIGDQQHEITTHSDTKGVKETREHLMNFDENELSDFEKRWLDVKSGKRFDELNSNSIVPELNPSAGDPLYLSLFKKFFGF